MTDPGYYDQSYPPSLWAAPVGAARQEAPGERPGKLEETTVLAGGGDAAPLPSGLTATAGQPGAYSPAIRPADRPRNMTELRERVTPADRAPWPGGAYLLIGESGRRAHWAGEDWHAEESPGYPGESRQRTTLPEAQPPGVSR